MFSFLSRFARGTPRNRALLIALGTAIFLSALGMLASNWYRDRLLNEKQIQVANTLNPYQSSLASAINRRFALLTGLYAFVQTSPSQAALDRDFEPFASQLYNSADGIRNFGVFPRGVIVYIHPLEGNEAVIGRSLLDDPRPDVRADVQRALATRRITLSGPYELQQGGEGLVARQALYLDGQFWGLVTMALDVPPILQEAGLSSPIRGLSLAIRNSAGAVFHGDPEVFSGDPLIERVELPEQYWEIAAIPGGGWESSVRAELVGFQAMTAALGLLITALVYSVAERQNRLALAVSERTAALEQELAERRRAERALRQSEERYRRLFEDNPLGLFRSTPDGTLLEVNTALVKLLGYPSREALLATNARDLYVDTLDRRRWIQQISREDVLHDFFTQLVCANGSRVWARITARAVRDENDQIDFFEGVFEDVTERLQAEEALIRSEANLRAVFDSSADAYLLLDQDMRILAYNWSAHTFSQHLYGQGLAVGLPLDQFTPPGATDEIRASFQRALSGEIVQSVSEYDFLPGHRWFALTFYPVRAENHRVSGVCLAGSDVTEQKQVEEALRQSNLNLRLAYEATLEGWAKALELRDRETEGHSRRVTALTQRLALAMGMAPEELVNVRYGALLHDIGKLGVPDSILQKPSALNEEETAVMQRHPLHARRMLAGIEHLRHAIDIPFYHHEKWDGSGYPNGLKGEEIPLSARIFAVVDVWDALLSERPYRPAWKEDQVIAYLLDQRSRHFDPRVVDAFIALLKEG